MSRLENMLSALEQEDNVTVSRSADHVTVTIKAPRPVKLHANKSGKGYLTSYTLTIGSAEARKLGFVDENGESYELEKHIDESAGTLTVTRKK